MKKRIIDYRRIELNGGEMLFIMALLEKELNYVKSNKYNEAMAGLPDSVISENREDIITLIERLSCRFKDIL